MKRIAAAALAAIILIALTACYIPRNGLYDNEMGTRYFVNDIYQTGWIEIDGNEYYFSRVDGYMVRESQVIEGQWYGITEDGLRANGFVEENGIIRYYTDGIYSIGWQEINGDKYYFVKETGGMVTGKYEISGLVHLFGEDGKYTPINGFKSDTTGTKYYIDDIYQTGWQEIDGNKYYFSKMNGYMIRESQYIEGKWYGFNSDGKLANGFLKEDDGTRYYNENGNYLTEWQEIDGAKYYFSKLTGLMLTGTHTISDVEYTFSQDGKLIEAN